MYNILSYANSKIYLSFQFEFIFLVWFLWLSILCWMEVAIVGVYVLFLILEEMLLDFHYWEYCWLWVCHIWSILCGCIFPLCSFCWEFFFYHKWIMNFVTIYSAFIEMIRWFLFFIFECGRSCWLIWRYQIHHLKNKTSNHIYLWDKSHLITWYDPSIYLFILFFNFTIFYWSF